MEFCIGFVRSGGQTGDGAAGGGVTGALNGYRSSDNNSRRKYTHFFEPSQGQLDELGQHLLSLVVDVVRGRHPSGVRREQLAVVVVTVMCPVKAIVVVVAVVLDGEVESGRGRMRRRKGLT